MAATAAIVAALTLAVKLEPVVADGVALLIAKIRKKKNPVAAATKASMAVQSVPNDSVAGVKKAIAAVNTEPDDPNVVPLDEEWEKDV